MRGTAGGVGSDCLMVLMGVGFLLGGEGHGLGLDGGDGCTT